MAPSALPSLGPKSGRYCWVTPISSGISGTQDKIRSGPIRTAFSGAQKWGVLLRNPCVTGQPPKRGKIKSGYITLAFSGAKKWAVLLRNPCVIHDPHKRGQSQKWLHPPCFLERAKVEGIAM